MLGCSAFLRFSASSRHPDPRSQRTIWHPLCSAEPLTPPPLLRNGVISDQAPVSGNRRRWFQPRLSALMSLGGIIAFFYRVLSFIGRNRQTVAKSIACLRPLLPKEHRWLSLGGWGGEGFRDKGSNAASRYLAPSATTGQKKGTTYVKDKETKKKEFHIFDREGPR